MPGILLCGIQLNYEVKGQGEPILMLHGWGGCIDSFLPVTNALSQNRCVYSIDFPGHGKTPEPDTAWCVDEYCALTIAFIEQVIKGKCSIIAHSFGGRVAIMLSAKRPQLVDKLVLCDSAGLIPKRSAGYYFKVYRYKLMKKAAKNRIGTSLCKLFGVDVQKKIQNAGSSDYRNLSEKMKKVFVRVVNQDLFGYLKDIKASTLLIWGSEDVDTPLEFGKIMEKEIPDAGLVVFEGAGHFSYLEQFGRFMAVVRHFLGGTN